MGRVDMVRGVLVAFALLGLSACRGQDSQSSAPAAEKTAQPPVSAPAEAAPAAPSAAVTEEAAPAEAAPARSEVAQRCFDLIAAEKYQDAVPACTTALQAEPANAEVKQALDDATAKLAGSVPSAPAMPKPSY
jgi:hypothetical protein